MRKRANLVMLGRDLFSVSLPFIINPDTGYLNTSLSLDREQQAKYILTVEVGHSFIFILHVIKNNK